MFVSHSIKEIFMFPRTIGSVVATLFVTLSAVAAPRPASAERAGSGFGGRVGVGFDPDQFVVGVQADVGPALRVARFVPSVDLGMGGDFTTFAINGDVIVRIFLPKSSAALYGGAGPTLVYWDPDEGDGDLEIGLSLVAGLRLPLATRHVYNIETRFGVSDVPDVRILLGVLFGAGRP
jgi:hypothetical protein